MLKNYVTAVFLENPNEELIDNAIDANFNTVYINITDRKFIEVLFEEFSDDINMIPVVLYIQMKNRLTDDDTFFTGEKYLKHVPCPTSPNIPKRLLELPLALYRDGLCNSVCIDFKDPLRDYHSEWKNTEFKCHCERCKDLNDIKQKMENVRLIKKTLNGMKLHSTPYINPFLWAISDSWLNKYTYNVWKPYKYIKKHISSMDDRDLILNNIAAVNYKDIKKAIKYPLTDGYCTYPENEDMEELKELNLNVSKYRSGLLYRLRRKLIR